MKHGRGLEIITFFYCIILLQNRQHENYQNPLYGRHRKCNRTGGHVPRRRHASPEKADLQKMPIPRKTRQVLARSGWPLQGDARSDFAATIPAEDDRRMNASTISLSDTPTFEIVRDHLRVLGLTVEGSSQQGGYRVNFEDYAKIEAVRRTLPARDRDAAVRSLVDDLATALRVLAQMRAASAAALKERRQIVRHACRKLRAGIKRLKECKFKDRR
jgi:hypothetical protein